MYRKIIKWLYFRTLRPARESETDDMYLFKAADYTTEIVGRCNQSSGNFYVQRGDGTIYNYGKDRIVWAVKLVKE
jgi:hypothetical protein